MSWPRIIERLEDGPVTIRPTGNSMTPMIRSKDKVTIERWPHKDPLRRFPLEVGLVVLAKVKGRFYLHKVTNIEGRYPNITRVEISNNHGHVNGWTSSSKVYGYVTKVER